MNKNLKTLSAALLVAAGCIGNVRAADAWEGSTWLSVPDAPVAQGIAKDGARAAPGTSWFVREVANGAEVVRAVWTTAGLGVYEVFVNGRRVGDDFLKPGFTHNGKTKYSFSYDVTGLLRRAKGETNVLAAEVSAGWWRDMIVTPRGHRGFIGRKSAFRGVLELTFADGTTRRVGTDAADWKAGIAGPVTEAAIFDGEHYDARQPHGFDRAVWSNFGRPEVNDEFQGEILPAEVAAVKDSVFPYFIVHSLPVGVTGVLVAAIVAAAMSTVSATLNSGATVLLEDWFRRYVRRNASERACVATLRASTVLLGLASIAVAFAVIGVESALSTWWTLQSVLSGGMLGLFLLGCASRRVGPKAAGAATVLGILTVAWVVFGQKALHPNLSIVFGTAVLFASGLAFSRLRRKGA